MSAPSEIGHLLRQLPGIGALLDSDAGRALVAAFGAGVVKFELRGIIDGIRDGVRNGEISTIPSRESIADETAARCARLVAPASREVINATGVLLHTNLGRAPLCAEAVEAMRAASGYTVLEIDREDGKRAHRGEMAERLICEITGAEAAIIVNNNAAATMLVLNTVAAGKEVVISRGQLVEIGGSFRMPDVMARSGAILREVGATNRTHPADYETAISPATGALLHVHTSNYRIRGFAGTPAIGELCALGKKHGIPVADDLGSGALVPLDKYGNFSEPLVADSLAAGASLVCFSGDKLIGGPQSGIILGSREWISRVRKNAYTRMFRADKFTFAGLEATLVHYLNGTFESAIPFYAMLSRPVDELQARAETLAEHWRGITHATVDIAADESNIGSGSIPDEGVPTRVLKLRPAPAGKWSAEIVARVLRYHTPAVFTRIADGALIFDMRTLLPGHADMLATIIPDVLADFA